MPTIVVASDSKAVRHEVIATVTDGSTTMLEASSGPDALALVKANEVDLCILDLQMSNMGAMAVTLELRLEESYGAIAHVPVLMLLDRRADVFLARRSGAEGFVVKPIDALRLRRATKAILAGEHYDDDSYLPSPVLVADTTKGA